VEGNLQWLLTRTIAQQKKKQPCQKNASTTASRSPEPSGAQHQSTRMQLLEHFTAQSYQRKTRERREGYFTSTTKAKASLISRKEETCRHGHSFAQVALSYAYIHRLTTKPATPPPHHRRTTATPPPHPRTPYHTPAKHIASAPENSTEPL